MPVPLTIAHTITDQINLLAARDRNSEMDLRRVKKEIEKVKNADAAQYYMLLGMFYSVTGDDGESRSNHERSLKLSSELVFLENYAFSLKRLGAVADSLKLILRAFEMAPTEDVLDEVAQLMIYAGDLCDFERVVQRYEKSNPGKNPDDQASVLYVRKAIEKLERAKVSFDDFKQSMALVKDLLSRKGFENTIKALSFKSGSFDDVPHVDIAIKTNIFSTDVLFDLNEEIAEVMAGAEHIEAWNRLVFTVCDYHDEKNSSSDVA